MNVYVSGKQMCLFLFSFFFLLGGSQVLKQRICSSSSKYFPLREYSILKELCCLGNQIEVTKVVSLCEKKSVKACRCIHSP